MHIFKHFISILFLYLIFITNYIIGEEPIIVRLSTESERLPVYITEIDTERSGFDSQYGKKLQKILEFDLNYNGMTSLIPTSKEKEKLAGGSSFDLPPHPSNWKQLNVFYVIKIQLLDQRISIRLFSLNSETAKTIEGISLTGDLAKDRRQIHQLADTIHKTLFGSPGIASTRILYTLKTKEAATLKSEIWEADYDGFNKKPITQDSGYSITPAYVPPKPGYNAGSIFFISYKTGQPKIYYQNLIGEPPAHRFTYLRGNQLMPAISRQRDKLAFICDITGNPDLFIQPFNPETGAVGKPYQIFSTHLATQGTPTFSPDGSQIAFVSNKDGSPRIYAMDVPEPGTSLNEIKARLLTKRNKESSAPSWSPDGKKIAYCSVNEGIRQIWIYDFTKNEEKQLTQGPGNKENPTWAPNSLHLMFNSSDRHSCDLYLVNLNQIESVKITSGEGEKRFPAWEPL